MSKHFRPKIGKHVYIHPAATVIGQVTLKDYANIWPGVVLRADINRIVVGKYSNIQDLSVVHVTYESHSVVIGDDVTIGHAVMMHGCTIESHCLIGMRATLMNDVVVGEYSIVGAGAVVTERTVIPPRSLVLGLPAKVKRSLTDAEVAGIDEYAQRYFEYKETYLAMKANQTR